MFSNKEFQSKPKKENKQSNNSSVNLNYFNVSQRQPVLNQRTDKPVQFAENNTGLPDDLKAGIENLSGYSMDDVKVHRNSSKPVQLNAHAYAQGTDIHLASGQEKHLPHEAWHVVQQKQGRVKPTMQMKDKININDDSTLEKEADVMGSKAIQKNENHIGVLLSNHMNSSSTVQRVSNPDFEDWYNHNKGDLAMFFSNLEQAKRLVPRQLKKALESLSIDELNKHYGFVSEEIPSVSHDIVLSDHTDYERTDVEKGSKPFGEISIQFLNKTSTSIKVQIEFNPLEGILMKDTKIGFIQIVKSEKVQDEAKERAQHMAEIKDPESKPESSDYYWSVDRQGSEFAKTPYFGLNNEGKSGDLTKLTLGTEKSIAKMVDEPSFSGKGKWSPSFETAAIIIECPDKSLIGSVLAVAKWNIELEPSKNDPKLTLSNIEKQETNMPSENFIEAVRIWNGIDYKPSDRVKDGKRELVDLGVLS